MKSAKHMPICVILLIVPMLAFADNFVVQTSPLEQQMVEAFAARLGVTQTQVVRRMCDSGMASFRGQYLKIITEQREQAIRQMTPQQRATVCAEYAAVGAPCPAEEP